MTDPTLLSERQKRLMEQTIAAHEKNPHPGMTVTRLRLHALLHVVAETQIEQRRPLVVVETLDRLLAAGLDRHKALHAISSVVAQQVVQVVADGHAYDEARYTECLRQLDADDWRGDRVD